VIFLSRTISEPYDIVDDLTLDETITLTGIDGMDSYQTDEKYLYLIVKDEYHDEIELLVENETATGVSFYISPVDPMGVPTHWGKQIILQNVDGRSGVFKYTFVYQWRVINNMYLVKDHYPTARLNIYTIDKYTT